MSINKYTPIHRVLTTYPQLIHRLVKRDSRYVSLINPVSTCTLGHCTTIESIAFTVGDDMETLLTYLKGEMEREDTVQILKITTNNCPKGHKTISIYAYTL